MKGIMMTGPMIMGPAPVRRKMTGPNFLNKYKNTNYVDRLTRLIMGDKYFLTLSPDEYQLLSDMNLIGSDDPEFEAFLMQYMEEKIIEFFSGCPDLGAYLETICSDEEKEKILNMDLDELKEYIKEKLEDWADQKETLLDNNKNLAITIPGDEMEI